MGKNVAHKVLEPHIVEGKWEPGKEIGIRIDQTLTQDATGTMAYLQFEAMGMPRVKTELSVSYVDHNTLQVGLRERRRPPLPADRRREVRHHLLPGRATASATRCTWSGSARPARRCWAPTPHAHRRRHRHDRHRRGRAGRGRGHGRRAVLPDLPQGRQGQPHGQAAAVGVGQGRHPQGARDLDHQGQRGHGPRVRRRRACKTLSRARARHHHQHGRRDAA